MGIKPLGLGYFIQEDQSLRYSAINKGSMQTHHTVVDTEAEAVIGYFDDFFLAYDFAKFLNAHMDLRILENNWRESVINKAFRLLEGNFFLGGDTSNKESLAMFCKELWNAKP